MYGEKENKDGMQIATGIEYAMCLSLSKLYLVHVLPPIATRVASLESDIISASLSI